MVSSFQDVLIGLSGEELPEGHRFTLEHLSESESKRHYGPCGDPDVCHQTQGVRTWHCCIERQSTCSMGHSHGTRWFKGHGFICLEAIAQAVKQMKSFDASEHPILVDSQSPSQPPNHGGRLDIGTGPTT